ncbi:hypothetical protein [Anaeromassilibacillus senegalensis]|uniref:hypothetical protein n=1 Tax=Anaeromassilibacillus senegalensis TaxID=1673717 RepID=UPI00068095C5|nr:hypothetical protein [Anaeromassilibacillus senegalensis]
MYNPKYITLPKDVYCICVAVAHSYYALLRRRKEIEEEIILSGHPTDGQPHGGGTSNETADKAEQIILRKSENEREIKAIEQALSGCRDDYERKFIRLNFFEGVWIRDINLSLSESTMKRYRKQFLIRLAINLHKI